MQKLLIVAGVVLMIVGLAWPWLASLGLGRLPGDITVERENWSFHFPIVTSVVISLVLTLLVWLFRR
jgi:hypothetical protein